MPGIIAGVDENNDGDSDKASSGCRERKIIVAKMLPLHIQRDPDTLKCSDQEEVAQKLLEEYNCVPTFLPHDLNKKYYGGFCKHQLWPLFHYMLPMCLDHADRFDRVLWKAYVSANKIFADKVMEVANPEDNYIRVHDYHLMILPTFLRNRCNRVKLGFFLHSPFPSSEIYRTLPIASRVRLSTAECFRGWPSQSYSNHDPELVVYVIEKTIQDAERIVQLVDLQHLCQTLDMRALPSDWWSAQAPPKKQTHLPMPVEIKTLVLTCQR
nr:probable alpha,alpha-trehalose-phosphate synthase [UDP-forming] 10 [Tanacetum cinerariifolium]